MNTPLIIIFREQVFFFLNCIATVNLWATVSNWLFIEVAEKVEV